MNINNNNDNYDYYVQFTSILFSVKRGNVREQQYTCCDAESGSDGCSSAKGHVFDNPVLREDGGYMTTLTPDPGAAHLFRKVRQSITSVMIGVDLSSCVELNDMLTNHYFRCTLSTVR